MISEDRRHHDCGCFWKLEGSWKERRAVKKMSSVTRVKQGRSGAAVTVSCRVGVAGRSVAWEGVGAGGGAALPSTGERREPGGGGGAAEAGRRRAGGNAYDRDAGGRRAVVHAGASGNKHHRLRRRCTST